MSGMRTYFLERNRIRKKIMLFTKISSVKCGNMVYGV